MSLRVCEEKVNGRVHDDFEYSFHIGLVQDVAGEHFDLEEWEGLDHFPLIHSARVNEGVLKPRRFHQGPDLHRVCVDFCLKSNQ